MNKEELLKELSAKVKSGEISRGEVMSRFEVSSDIERDIVEKVKSFHFSITKLLYALGAIIVLIGTSFFIAQVWDDIGGVGRISITLGLGLLTTALGSFLLKKKPEEKVGSIFHIIGGLLIPGGAMVTLSEFSVEVVSLWPIAITFGAIFAFYLLLNYVHKNAVLTFFAIANGTAFTYLLVESIIPGPSYRHEKLYAYLTMMMGASYILLAHAFRTGWNKILVRALYFFGALGFMGAAFSQVWGSTPDALIWQALYFFLVAGGMFLATKIKSNLILLVSTGFLIAHVSYITSKYFADSIGWPISLVILGFIFIGLGYFSITINKKYIKKG